jgi:hypothetical protein
MAVDCMDHMLVVKPEIPETRMRADTIYQIDTVFQYEIIYDTLYYFDSIPQMDTLINSEVQAEITDSTVILSQVVNFKIVESKRVFTSGSQKIRDNSVRDFGDAETAIPVEYIGELNDQTKAGDSSGRSSASKQSSQLPADKNSIFTYQARDTLFRWDTIVSFETRFDTVIFESNARSDTSLSNSTKYEKFGRTVLAKEIVNVKVVQRENLFVEKPRQEANNNKNNKNERKSDRVIQSSSLNNNQYRRDLRGASRSLQNKKGASYSSYVRFGAALFDPEIVFSAENEEVGNNIAELNENIRSEPSYGLSLTYNYFKNKWGFETGFGLTKQNYTCDHQFELINIDTTYYWDYFEKEDYLYDTTWYINIDSLLQTGDTLLVPNVDSTMIQVTDSIQSPAYDTTYALQNGRYNFSFSYLEIPIIGHYSIVEKKLFLRIAAGVIPTFLIGKSGSLDAPDANGLTDVKDISFDYGFSLTAYGSCVLGYHVTDKWDVYLEPFIKRNLFSAMRNNDFLVKTNAWGFKVGVAYRLFSFSD